MNNIILYLSIFCSVYMDLEEDYEKSGDEYEGKISVAKHR